MKKIIKEQSLMSTFNNKKVNLYSDPENKNFIGQATIMSVDPINSKDKRNWLGNAVFEIQIRQKDPANGREAQVKLNFLCGTLPFPDTKNKKAGLYFDNGNRQVYSYNFEEALKKFCTVSKGGAAVPKADFVSTNATPDQVMGEGKKVVRLSESDLIKIVKRVIKEQTMGGLKEPSVDIDMETEIRNSKKRQLKDMIINFDSIGSCEGINQVDAEEMMGSRPERDMLYCLYYNGKTKSELIDIYKSI